MTNARKFEAALLVRGKTKADIAKLLGRSLQTVYNKINNIADFKATEIALICDCLKLSKKERDEIFFAKEVE